MRTPHAVAYSNVSVEGVREGHDSRDKQERKGGEREKKGSK